MQGQTYAKLAYWAKQISITGTAQIIVQAVGFLSGILVIRLLPVEQYAYYTIANAMLGMMTVLSDGGISSGVMAQGGKVWQDKEKLGAVLNTGLYLRKRFAWTAIVVSVPLLCYLLWKQGADWITCLLLTASLIPAFFAALSDNILQIVPKLHQSIRPLQKNQVSVGIGRLLLSGLTLFAFPWAFVAVLASGIPRIWGNLKLQKIAEPYADRAQEINKEAQNEIMGMVKRIMPGAIYFAFSGQITIWLLSFFGASTAIAQIGALGRFSIVTAFLSTILSTIIIPRYARSPHNRKVLLHFFCFSFILLFVICGIIVFLFYLFSDEVLFLLGDSYTRLNYELVLLVSASCVGLLNGFIFNLGSARGKPTSPLLIIIIHLLTILFSATVFDIGELEGVLKLSVLINIVPTILHIGNFYFNIYKKTASI